MNPKEKVFYEEKLDKIPFFLRYYQVRKNTIPANDNDTVYRDIKDKMYDHIPAYHSRVSKCVLPLKPISKILLHDEQKLL